MILLAGIQSEPPLAMVRDAAEAQGIDVLVYDQRQARQTDLGVDVAGGWIQLDGRMVDLDDIAGVYLRMMDPRELPESRADPDGRGDPIGAARAALGHALLGDWIAQASCRVMNRQADMASNVSKPFQARRICQVGFETPATLITTDPAAVRDFLAEHGRVIFKSISATRSIVRTLQGADLVRLDAIRALPTQFQAWVPGVDHRVHVVGDEVFAVRIDSDAVDYRYAGRDGEAMEMHPTELPADVAERCRRLSAALRLPLCGIDLRARPDGGWTCFEVNPSPAYSWYEQKTGQPIAAAIARWLDGAAPEAR